MLASRAGLTHHQDGDVNGASDPERTRCGEGDGAGAGKRSYEEYARDTIVGTPETVVERLQQLVEAGADYFIVSIPRVAYDQEPLQQFAQEVMPRFRL